MSDMNEQQFANRIRQALNQGTRIDSRITERLRLAREQALERQRAAPESELAWASDAASGVLSGFGGYGGFSLRVLLPTALMIAGVVGIYFWQQEQRAVEVEELDAQLLTDDLPIDAYLDRGFEAWLKKTANK